MIGPLPTLSALSACLLAGICFGAWEAKHVAEERIADAMARQQVAAENAAGLAAMRDVEARQEQIKQDRLRWIESLGKD